MSALAQCAQSTRRLLQESDAAREADHGATPTGDGW